MMAEVVGLGMCTVDKLVTVPHIPHANETLPMYGYAEDFGGPVATALCTLATLGVTTAFVGAIGDDEFGREIKGDLQRANVDVSPMQILPGRRSAFSVILIDSESGDRSIIFNPGCSFEVAADKVPRDLVAAASYLHLDGSSADAAAETAALAREASVRVSLDAGDMMPGMDDLIKLCDVVVASQTFARQITGIDEEESALRSLAGMGPAIVGITLGIDGSICLVNDEMIRQPAFGVNAADTTGAGDSYHGAFIYGLLQGWDISRVMMFASAVAAMDCTHVGGRAGLPTRAEVDAFIEKARKR
jgi:sulfofructose kinase